MNKRLIAPVALIAAIALKQYLGIEFTETQIESAIEVVIEIVAAIYAAATNPKKG